MSSPPQQRVRRRTLLTAATVPVLAGCIIDLSSCTIGKTPFDTDVVDRFSVSSGDGYVREGEFCDTDSNNCLRIAYMAFDPIVVDRIDVETTDGDVVRSHEVEGGELTEFELGEFGSRGSLEREIVLRDEDGNVIDRGGAHAECRL